MKRVVFIGDLSRGDQARNVVHTERLFSPLFKQLGISSSVYVSEVNRSGCLDDWLGGWQESLVGGPTPILETIDFEGAAVVGFEIPEKDLQYFDRLGIPWVNFAIHPIRFLEDLYFDVSTSFAYDFRHLAASLGQIDLCVQALRTRYHSHGASFDNKTLAIFGQTPIDKSVFFDGCFRKLDHYISRLDELAGCHDHVIFRPHPYLTDPAVDALIRERYGAELHAASNVYQLFVSGAISTLCAISSSVVTEAPFFGIASEYLECRAKRFGPAVSYRALLDDQKFWVEGLLGGRWESGSLRISQGVPQNYLRQVFCFWGYVTEEQALESRLAAKQDELLQVITQQNERSIQQSEARAQQSEARAQQSEARAQESEARAQQLEMRLREAERCSKQAEERARLADTGIEQCRAELNALDKVNHHHWLLANERGALIDEIHRSHSWRITAPLRMASSSLRKFADLDRLRQLAADPAAHAILYVSRRPRLKRLALRALPLFPGLGGKFLAKRTMLMTAPTVQTSGGLPDLAALTPRSREMFKNLQNAIERSQKG